MTGCYKPSDEPSGFMKCGEILGKLRHCYLSKKGFTPFTHLVGNVMKYVEVFSHGFLIGYISSMHSDRCISSSEIHTYPLDRKLYATNTGSFVQVRSCSGRIQLKCDGTR